MLEVLGTAKPMQNTAEPLQAGCYMTRFEYACVPQPCMFEHMSPANGTGLVGCGSFKIQVLDGRRKVLGACLAGYTPVRLPTLFWSARLSELSILSCRQPSKPSFPRGCKLGAKGTLLLSARYCVTVWRNIADTVGNRLRLSGSNLILLCLKLYSIQTHHFHILVVTFHVL